MPGVLVQISSNDTNHATSVVIEDGSTVEIKRPDGSAKTFQVCSLNKAEKKEEGTNEFKRGTVHRVGSFVEVIAETKPTKKKPE